jgi:predicted transposase YbfD/YdcC
VVRTHQQEGQPDKEQTTYYLTSMGNNVQEIAKIIRGHWQIESDHWSLDVTFREDESLIYVEDGAKNIALFKRMLVNLLKRHPLKDSIAGKRHRSAWADDFRT